MIFQVLVLERNVGINFLLNYPGQIIEIPETRAVKNCNVRANK